MNSFTLASLMWKYPGNSLRDNIECEGDTTAFKQLKVKKYI